jgi:eukaryotic-like serine/threonine-protein kinase
MTDRPQHTTTTRADETRQRLAERIDALRAAWDAAAAPPLLPDLIAADAFAGKPELRRMILAELIKVDLEFRWQGTEHRKRIEDYVAEFPEIDSGGIPSDLIYEEYRIRKIAGEHVAPEEYLGRFPEQAEELVRLFGAATSAASTTMAGGRRVPDVHVGDAIDDFDLLASLGEGAFANVFLARQRSMQRLVALKVSADQGEEPQTLAQLDHPHIVRVYDQRQLPERQARLLYMQLVPGGTLESVRGMRLRRRYETLSGRDLLALVDDALDQRGHAPPVDSPSRAWLASAPWWQTVAWLGVGIAKALGYAHTRDVLHRDVKPANVLLDADAQPKLADFNVSFCSKVEGASPTAFFGGSLPYMSPEQIEACSPAHDRTAEQLDARSDIYSLGVILWELLTGRMPYGDVPLRTTWSQTLSEMLRIRREPLDTKATVRGLDMAAAPLVKVLQACLAPRADDRPPSGEEVARRLQLCLMPEVQTLVTIEPGTWRHSALAHPFMWTVTAGLVPNILAGFFNYQYNEDAIVSHLDAPSQAVFARLSTIINGVAFPLGGVLGILLVWRLARSLRRRGAMGASERARARHFALVLGFFAAVVGAVEWFAAGPVFPLGFHLLGGHVPPAGWVHFFASMTLCGLIAAAYPFLLITRLGTRVYYPALLGGGETDPADERVLARTAAWAHVFLGIAAAIPMLGVMLAAFSGSAERFVLGTMNLLALVSFLFAFWVYRGIQRDLGLLREAVHL